MGSDSSNKSAISEQRQRLIIVISLAAISLAFFMVISLLSPPHTTSNLKGNGGSSMTKSDSMVYNIKSADNNLNIKLATPALVEKPIVEVTNKKSEKEVATIRADLEAQVRAIKKTGVIMETDPKSLELTTALQAATRDLLKVRYGDYGTKNYRIKFDLEFQSTIPDFETKGKDGSLLIELAPISLIPCSVYNFLEIARTWKKGAFHRNAGHVLQAIARSDITQSMPFQEYNKEYPHKKGTIGYAGRPSGPEFYVSTQDNSRNHGPGSQQKHNPYEADCIIGTVIQGMEDGTVDRIHTMPGKEFLSDKKKWVLIRRMHILVPGDGPDGYIEFSSSPDVIPVD